MKKKWLVPGAIVMVAVALTAFLIPANAQISLFGGSDDGTGEKPSWGVKTVVMENGRKYYALMPGCGNSGCKVPRELFIFTHGVGGPEDVVQAGNQLKSLRVKNPDAIFAYSVSKDGTKRFDAGVEFCCTWTETQEVQYLIDVVNDIAARTPVDRSQVGLFGKSNGGMLTERAVCTRPDVFEAGASWAGTWTTQYEGCQHGKVNIEQWHGDKDTVAPINGGCVPVDKRTVCIPPASELGTKITPESNFELHVVPGEDHVPPGWVIDEMTVWLDNAVNN